LRSDPGPLGIVGIDQRQAWILGFGDRRWVVERKAAQQGNERCRKVSFSLRSSRIRASFAALLLRSIVVSRSLETVLSPGYHVGRRSCLHLCGSDLVRWWHHHHRILLGFSFRPPFYLSICFFKAFVSGFLFP
jgi:hypothetical protein